MSCLAVAVVSLLPGREDADLQGGGATIWAWGRKKRLLGAIKEKVQRATGVDYIAGIWNQFLCMGKA